MRLSAIALILVLAGCGSDPCATAVNPTPRGSGEASLTLRMVEEDGNASTLPRRLECIDVLVVNPSRYADTLAAGRFRLSEDHLRLDGLPAGLSDVIVDAPGYFPAKFTDVELAPGMNTLPDKVLMFKTNVDVVLPAQLGVTLRSGARLDDLRNLYAPYGRVQMKAAPGHHYELRLPFRGTRLTRGDVESLLGVLVRSPHVETARPLVTLTAALRAASR